MAISPEIREALDPKKLDLPPEPKVLAIDVQEHVSRDGEEMLRVFVTIDEDTDVEKWPGAEIIKFKRVIRDKLRSIGVELFPIVHVAKPRRSNP